MQYLNERLIYGFSAAFLHSRFDNPAPFPAIHLDWWKLCCTDYPKVAIAAPRGHAKSTAITHTFALAALLWRERDFCLIVSDTEGQAVQFLGDIKRELQENDELIAEFGIKKFVRDTAADIIVEFQDGNQFRIIAKGSEQKVRGLKWRNKRPNLIIGDDLENDEIVMNDERRLKFRQWLFNALIPAGSDDCIIRIVGTILHMDSGLERLMPPLNDSSTLDNGLAQWSTKARNWLSVRYRAHNEDFSKILWPEKFPKERLQAIRQDFIDQGFPEGYSQEYLNYPIDEENAYYHKENFLEISDENEYGEYYVGSDFAISERDSRAYTVFVVGKLLPSGILQIVNVLRFRGDGRDIIDAMFRINAVYHPEWYAVETENIAKTLGPFLREEMMNRGEFLHIVEVPPVKDKMSRGRSMQARIKMNTVEFDHNAPWFPEYQTEMLHFPRGKYKDQADATHTLGMALDKMTAVPTAEELEDIAYEEEFGDGIYDLVMGDSITGYGD